LNKAKNIKLIPAEQINATTAGLKPFNIPLITPIFPYLKNNFAKIIPKINDGVTNPNVATIAPKNPATFMPTKVAALIPIGPGVI